MLLPLISILDSLSKTGTNFAQSIINSILDHLEKVMDSFPVAGRWYQVTNSLVNGLGTMTKAVGVVLSNVKGKMRSNDEIVDKRFLGIYQKLIDYVNSLNETTQLLSVLPSPLPATLGNVNSYVRSVNRLYGKRKLLVC